MSDKKFRILSRLENLAAALFQLFKKASFTHRLALNSSPKGKIFVLGNGPSFKIDAEKWRNPLMENDCIVVNFFAQSDEFEILKPKFYILADPVFFHSKEQLSAAHFQLQEKIIALLNEKVNWAMTLIFPTEARPYIQNLGLRNPNIQLLYFNSNKVDSSVFNAIKHWMLRTNMASVTKMNVLISATYCALNLGYQSLILLGADHSWAENFRIDAQNRPYIFDPHFYNSDKAPVFLYKNAQTQEYVKAHDFFQGLATAFEAYWELKNYAKSIHSDIKNGSNQSFIDAFERINPPS